MQGTVQTVQQLGLHTDTTHLNIVIIAGFLNGHIGEVNEIIHNVGGRVRVSTGQAQTWGKRVKGETSEGGNAVKKEPCSDTYVAENLAKPERYKYAVKG